MIPLQRLMLKYNATGHDCGSNLIFFYLLKTKADLGEPNLNAVVLLLTAGTYGILSELPRLANLQQSSVPEADPTDQRFGAKFVGLTAGLILLLSLTALISLHDF